VSLSFLKRFFAARAEPDTYLKTPFGKVWYSRRGDALAAPLIVVHGGPGFPHNYLLTLDALKSDVPLIFYDQFGCGRSPSGERGLAWTTAQFVQELKLLIERLAPRGAHVLGHSWGAVPAIKAALSGSKVRSLILASPFISAERWLADADRLRALLPPDIQSILRRGDETGEYTEPEYLSAQAEYYSRFVTGSHRYQDLSEASRVGAGREVYASMWGPNEFVLTGPLKNCELTGHLSELEVPVLFTCGRNDEASPESIEYFASCTKAAATRVFELSAHNPHLSEPQEYLRTVREFLGKVPA